MDPVIEPHRDGSIIVRGLSLDEVRRRLATRPVGRPAEPVIAADRILEAVQWLQMCGMPTSERWVADQAGCTRRQLRAAISTHWPGRWSEIRGEGTSA